MLRAERVEPVCPRASFARWAAAITGARVVVALASALARQWRGRASAKRAAKRQRSCCSKASRTLSDEGLRRSYLEQDRRQIALIVRAWFAARPPRRCPRASARRTSPAKPSLRAPFERLVDTGRSPQRVAQRHRAQRVPGRRGHRALRRRARAAGAPHARGPADRLLALAAWASTRALLQAIAPWLDEARRTRAARLRHLPEGADAARPALVPRRAADRATASCWASSTPTSTARSAASTTPTATSWGCWPRRPPWRWTTAQWPQGSSRRSPSAPPS